MNQIRGFVIYHLREVLVEALADIDGNDSLYRYLRARSRLRLITMSEEELQELTQFVSLHTKRPAETVNQEFKDQIAEFKQTANEWLKDLQKDTVPSQEKETHNRVLIIENETSLREELVSVFNQAGFIVSAVPDYSKALQRLYEFKTDLIIMESLLPNDDGFKACRDFYDMFNIPIILLGQDSSDEVWEKVMKAGADHFEVKPCQHLSLVARAKAILRRYQSHKASRDNHPGYKER